jgi:hypothetical protein
MYTFRTPTIDEGPTGNTRLDQFYTLPRGITILKVNGKYREERYPLSSDVKNAEIAYVGGHVYTVTNSEAADLTAAGYGDYLTEIN